jgi:cytochrome P450
MTQPHVWEQILDYSNRATPYPFYAELRKTPVTRLPDGTYVVSTYAEIATLLHDPRVSSEISRNPAAAAAGAAGEGDGAGMSPTFLSMDPPDHDQPHRIRQQAAEPAAGHRPAAVPPEPVPARTLPPPDRHRRRQNRQSNGDKAAIVG